MEPAGKAAVRLEIVDESSVNQRLDNFLLKMLKGVPKSHVYRILRRGEVRVNGQRAQPERKLLLDDKVRVPPVRLGASTSSTAPRNGGEAQVLGAHVIYEDDWLLVLDKPSGWAVHGGSGVARGVIEQLRAERPTAKFLELVHRIDRDTSGLLLLAKKRSTLTALHEDLREGRVTKHYRVLAHGTWRKGRRMVEAALQETLQGVAEKRMRVAAAGEGGQSVSAKTEFMPLATWKAFSLLDAHLFTGSTHQIRVHLSHVSHPILGDDKYGDPERDKPLKKLGIRRLMLHSFSLRFKHPGTGEPMSIEAPLPPDFTAFIEQLDARAAEERLLRTPKAPDAQPL
ncbi:MAG: RluA family pseudouridine synthase [Proteobacteria bacterium]|nr:RluA family pseudouridine synthase [Pseudomonadota bacterium]